MAGFQDVTNEFLSDTYASSFIVGSTTYTSAQDYISKSTNAGLNLSILNLHAQLYKFAQIVPATRKEFLTLDKTDFEEYNKEYLVAAQTIFNNLKEDGTYTGKLTLDNTEQNLNLDLKQFGYKLTNKKEEQKSKIESEQPITEHHKKLKGYLDTLTNFTYEVSDQTYTIKKNKAKYCTLEPGCVKFTGDDEAKVRQCLELVILSKTGMTLEQYAKDPNKQPLGLEVNDGIKATVNKILGDEKLKKFISVNQPSSSSNQGDKSEKKVNFSRSYTKNNRKEIFYNNFNDVFIQRKEDNENLKNELNKNNSKDNEHENPQVNVNYKYIDADMTASINAYLGDKKDEFKQLLKDSYTDTTVSYRVAVLPPCEDSGGTPITYFIDKFKQPAPDQNRPDDRADVFDECEQLLKANACNLKILFPYNIEGNTNDAHWQLGEITICKSGEKIDIKLTAHDPFGSGQIKEAVAKDVKLSIESRLKTILGNEIKIKFENADSPYETIRQKDGTSCGVIVAKELTQRLNGEALDTVYPEGCEDLRLEQQLVKEKSARISLTITRFNF